jgi:hypothetical protein
MNGFKRTMLAVSVVGILACQGTSLADVEVGSLDPIPALHDLDWGAVEPAAAWDYWELRRTGPAEHPVIGSGGALNREELDPDVRGALDATVPSSGFSAGCLPAWCYSYVVAVDGEVIVTVNTREALAEFLAPITTPEEAIVLASAADFAWWNPDGESTGVREAGTGWDIVLLQLVGFCAPVQTDRVRFRVEATGQVSEQAREVWQRHEQMCI